MSGLERPGPVPSGLSATTTEPKSCPQCGSRDLREVAQTQYITYLSCGRCRYLVTLSRPGIEPFVTPIGSFWS
jgi:hypothetical protein